MSNSLSTLEKSQFNNCSKLAYRIARLQGPLRLSVLVPNFVVRLSLALLSLFCKLPFSHRRFLEVPHVFTAAAEFWFGIPLGRTERLTFCCQKLGCLLHLSWHWHSPSPTRSLELLVCLTLCVQPVLCGRACSLDCHLPEYHEAMHVLHPDRQRDVIQEMICRNVSQK